MHTKRDRVKFVFKLIKNNLNVIKPINNANQRHR